MADSKAKLPGASPGARIHRGDGKLRVINLCVTKELGGPYKVREIEPDCS